MEIIPIAWYTQLHQIIIFENNMKKEKIWNIISPVLIIGTTILVILFSRGWRINIKDRTVVSTGILDINSDPKGANVYINGEKKETTPAVIDSLTAGEYLIELRKDGYVSWQKNINIEEEKVNKLTANLFEEKAELQQISDFPVEEIYFSNDGDQALVVNKRNNYQGIWRLQLNQNFFQLEKSNVKVADLMESTGLNLVNSSYEILINNNFSFAVIKTALNEPEESNYYLINIKKENSEIQVISDLIPDNARLAWAEDSKHLIIENDQQLLSLNIQNLQQIVITNQLEAAWDTDTEDIYYTTKLNNSASTKIYRSNLDGTDRNELSLNNVEALTGVSELVMNQEHSKLFILLDSTYLIFDTAKNTVTSAEGSFALISKSPSLEYFLFEDTQNQQIQIYDFEQNTFKNFSTSINVDAKTLKWSPNSLRLFVRKTDEAGVNSVSSYDYDGANFVETIKFDSYNGSLASEFGFSSDSKKVFLPLPSNIQTVTGEQEKAEEILYEISLR